MKPLPPDIGPTQLLPLLRTFMKWQVGSLLFCLPFYVNSAFQIKINKSLYKQGFGGCDNGAWAGVCESCRVLEEHKVSLGAG